jgi:hypothetical protein
MPVLATYDMTTATDIGGEVGGIDTSGSHYPGSVGYGVPGGWIGVRPG